MVPDKKQLKILATTDLGKNSWAAERFAIFLAKCIGARTLSFHCLGKSYGAIIHDRSTRNRGVTTNNVFFVIAGIFIAAAVIIWLAPRPAKMGDTSTVH